jgi:hypothetical protein
MRRHFIEIAATAVFAGPMLATIGAINGKANSWIFVGSILVAAAGAAGIAFACRQEVSLAVRLKRILALALLGVVVPVFSGIAIAAAEVGAWGVAIGAVLAFVLVTFGLSRLTPLSINTWVSLEPSMPPNKSMERTREG